MNLGSGQDRERALGGHTTLSVVICCYNSARRLPETLRHLAEQTTPRQLEWEIIIVDNASTDDTVAVAQDFAATHPQLAVRIVSEPQSGQMYARIRGMRSARGEIILFVDDDNWLSADYVALTAETMAAHHEIGALGGTSTAIFEQDPPAWMARHQRWYAVSGVPQEGAELQEVNFLWGAGTAFRRSALELAVSHNLLVSGRTAISLAAGDDHELCYRLRRAGQKLFCHPRLRFRHYLPARRLQWAYLRDLHFAEGQASVLLDVYRIHDAESPRRWPKWLLHSWHAQALNVCFRLLRHPVVLWRASRESMESDDRVLMVEVFRGRLAALKRFRTTYRQMLGSREVFPKRAESIPIDPPMPRRGGTAAF